jgi:hypothetical protein
VQLNCRLVAPLGYAARASTATPQDECSDESATTAKWTNCSTLTRALNIYCGIYRLSAVSRSRGYLNQRLTLRSARLLQFISRITLSGGPTTRTNNDSPYEAPGCYRISAVVAQRALRNYLSTINFTATDAYRLSVSTLSGELIAKLSLMDIRCLAQNAIR